MTTPNYKTQIVVTLVKLFHLSIYVRCTFIFIYVLYDGEKCASFFRIY